MLISTRLKIANSISPKDTVTITLNIHSTIFFDFRQAKYNLVIVKRKTNK